MLSFPANAEATLQASSVEAILALLLQRTGTDFSEYRAATVERRIRNRMISLGIEDFERYLVHLRRDTAETSRLVERVTIKVSQFYRNRPAFDALRTEVLPALAKEAGPRPLRVWSAGCARGEEAYTLAMLLDELGREDVVFATDLDQLALEGARQAIYPAESLVDLPGDLRERYIESVDSQGRDSFTVCTSLRKRVTFAQHDLTSREPPGEQRHFDLICCRNVLIYLQRSAQGRVFAALRAALAPRGFLCLGEAECPPHSLAPSLSALARKTRIFRAREGFDAESPS